MAGGSNYALPLHKVLDFLNLAVKFKAQLTPQLGTIGSLPKSSSSYLVLLASFQQLFQNGPPEHTQVSLDAGIGTDRGRRDGGAL